MADLVPAQDDPPPAQGSSGTPDGATIAVPRWVQLATLPILLIVAWFLIGIVGQAIFIFVFAALIALVLNPLVRLLERLHIPRFVGVFVVYLAVVGVVVGVGWLVVPPLVDQVKSLTDNLPGMAEGARSGIDELQRAADRLELNVDVRAEIEHLASSLAGYVPDLSQRVYVFGRSVVATITLTIITIVVSIYMLLDARRLKRFVVGHFPTGSPDDGEEYVRIAQSAVVNYVKAQILLSAALGASAGFAMWLLGVTGVFPAGDDYALFFGAWTALMEVIPYLGPVLAAIPASVVALLHSPLTMLWVILAYLAIQQIEGHVLTPTIMGQRFRVHPLIVIFAILAGNEIHGVTGMFVAIPLIPLVKETYVFLRPRVRFEGWRVAAGGTPPGGDPPSSDPVGLAAGESGGDSEPEPGD